MDGKEMQCDFRGRQDFKSFIVVDFFPSIFSLVDFLRLSLLMFLCLLTMKTDARLTGERAQTASSTEDEKIRIDGGKNGISRRKL